MRLERLQAAGFRNLASLDLELGARFVVWYGPNGMGKTNALEAVHWLAALKPLRGARVRDLVGWEQVVCSVAGRARAEGVSRTYQVELGPVRKIALDGRPVADLADYFAGLRCIAFQPSDAEIVSGEPARRRAWIDRAAFTASPSHLGVARTLRRVVDQKSALLRNSRPDLTLLDALDDQLASTGSALIERRIAILREVEPHAVDVHRSIAGGLGRLGLTYRSYAVGDDARARGTALRERIGRARSEELRRRQVLVGPQLDDLAITLDDQPARGFASRGQGRSIVLALKLAELVAARRRGEVPLFLLDDVSSELDRERTGRVVGALADLGAQVFATTTEPGHLGALPPSETLWLRVDHGRIAVTSEP